MRLSTARMAGISLAIGLAASAFGQHGAPAAQNKPVHDVATQGPPPKMVLGETEFNFGEVWSGDKVEKDIAIENKGQAPLQFSVKSSCGCTVAQLSVAARLSGDEYQYQLEPGQSDKIKVGYDTKKNRKDVSQTITVSSNDPAQPQATITVKGTVKRLLEVNPERVNFANLTAGQVASQTVDIKSNQEAPIQLKVKPPIAETPFEFKLEETVPGKEFKLTATTKSTIKVGANNASVVLETGLTQMPEFPVSVMAYIPPRVQVKPEVLFVSPKTNKEHERVVRVTYTLAKPLKVLSVKSNNEMIKAEVLPQKQPAGANPVFGTYEIKVTLPPGDKVPAEGAQLEVTTDDPDPSYNKFFVKVQQSRPATRPAAVGPAAPPAPAPAPDGAAPAGQPKSDSE